MKKIFIVSTFILIIIQISLVNAQSTVNPKLGPMKPGSNADDPAIWIHPTDRSKSLLFLSDKSTGIYAYDVNGKQVHHINFGTSLNNIDVRNDFNFGGQTIDILAGNLRDTGKLAVLKINPDWTANNVLTVLADQSSTGNDIAKDSYGFTLYRRPSDGVMFVFDKPKSSSPIKQYRIDGSSGQIKVTAVRTVNDVSIGVAEGFVADDNLNLVYFAEETVGIHKYNADSDSSNLNRLSFFAQGDGISGDREGLALYACNDGAGYLVLSSQGNSQFKVYERQGNNRFVKTFLAKDSEGTDGLDVSTYAIPGFPNGFSVIHDDPQMQYYVYDWADIAGSDMKICVDGGSSASTTTTTIPSTKKGDLNNDGKVDIIDLGILLSSWGRIDKPPTDINQDGKVDIIDLGILLSNWS